MQADIHEQWTVSEDVYDGHRVILCTNAIAEKMLGDRQYPFRLGIAIPFKSPKSDGMPPDQELAPLNDIEDALIAHLESTQLGIVCLVFTTQGMREFLIQTMSDKIGELIEQLSKLHPDYHIQHYVTRDEAWEEVASWLN